MTDELDARGGSVLADPDGEKPLVHRGMVFATVALALLLAAELPLVWRVPEHSGAW